MITKADAILEDIGGCGDSSCAIIVRPNSLVTNGGCRCNAINMRRAIGRLKAVVNACAAVEELSA